MEKKYFVNLSWVIPCCEQKLGIGAQAMCIACNDTSVIVINFRKSKTHAITDTYCTCGKMYRYQRLSALAILTVVLIFCGRHVHRGTQTPHPSNIAIRAVDTSMTLPASALQTTSPKPYNFGDAENAETWFRHANLVLYTRLKFVKGWNETRSCFFPSMQLFWPHASILIGLDAESRRSPR